jgi:signal transduction histidine kinase/CheY-like chemotaxis protein
VPPDTDEVLELLTVEIERELDVIAVRQRGRDVAVALGLDAQDQVRIATALSEVGREVLAMGGASIVFALIGSVPPALVITLTTEAAVPQPRDATQVEGVLAARRLLDEVTFESLSLGARLRLVKWLPGHFRLPTAGQVKQLRRTLEGPSAVTPMSELRTQNSEMMAALDELQSKQDELLRLNAELEETNRGVLAMYSQLSDELEETNRGVVALYAELDEKSAQLKQANEAKSRFLANVSHELRTPINSILGLARLLDDAPDEPLSGEQVKQVTFIRSNANDLLALVNQLLDLAKAESGRLEPVLTEVRLEDVFAQVRGSLRPLAARGAVDLLVEDPVDVRPLYTDEGMLLHILRNLLTNALKFTERGHVRLSARSRESGQYVGLTVEDTGIGIAEADQVRAFEEFFQVAGPLQAKAHGTGLGLPYARRLAELLGGSLTLSSVPGEGSTFTLELPITWNAAMAASQSQPAVVPTGISVGTVLVVDDDESFRHVLRSMLQGAAERVLEAADGVDALRQMQESVPDVIFLDLRMPALDGHGVLKAMADDPRLQRVPVVVVSSYDLPADTCSTLPPTAVTLTKSGLTRERVLSVVAGLAGEGADG